MERVLPKLERFMHMPAICLDRAQIRGRIDQGGINGQRSLIQAPVLDPGRLCSGQNIPTLRAGPDRPAIFQGPNQAAVQSPEWPPSCHC